jgi:hypothetical protein
MRIITKRRILDYAKQHPNAAANLNAWISVASAAQWQSIAVGNYSGAKSSGWPANADLMESIRLRPCLRVVER